MSFEAIRCFSRVVENHIENSFRRCSIILDKLFVIASRHTDDSIIFLQQTKWSKRCSFTRVRNSYFNFIWNDFLSEHIFYNNLSLPFAVSYLIHSTQLKKTKLRIHFSFDNSGTCCIKIIENHVGPGFLGSICE